VALCWPENSKLCALFYDQITIINEHLFFEGDAPKELLLSRDRMPPNIAEGLPKFIKEEVELDVRIVGKSPEPQKFDPLQLLHSLTGNLFINFLQQQGDRMGLCFVPFFRESRRFYLSQPQGDFDTLELMLTKVRVINPTNLEWDQVLQIRRDPDSNQKLRRFRLFMTEKYKQKSESYIKDDLLLRIYDYEQACKKHGLKLKQSVIAKLLDSKSLLGMLGLSAASVLLGEPLIAGVTMVTGTCLEIGKIAIHILQKKLEFKSNHNNAEISYLMDIKGKMEKEQSCG
jgi:hypothetical protein